MKYLEIQNEVVERYRVKINENSNCWSRMHVHVRDRMICKWHPKNSAEATFELLHEIGHIENNSGKMRRCEQEYWATVWAVDRCHEYGVKIPDNIQRSYQRYINMELDRGKRRGGANYPDSLDVKW